jgi:hypothetical protein
MNTNIMFTQDYLYFDHIQVDREAAEFEATLHEPSPFFEAENGEREAEREEDFVDDLANDLADGVAVTDNASTFESNSPSTRQLILKRALDLKSRATKSVATQTSTAASRSTEEAALTTDSGSNVEDTDAPVSLRSKAEAAQRTSQLVNQMRQLSRGLGLGRSGQLQVGQVHTESVSTATVSAATASTTAVPTAIPASVTSTEAHAFPGQNQTVTIAAGYLASGCPGLDRLLPGGGYEPGSLVEWFGSGSGGAAGSLAMFSAIPAMREGKALVVIDWNSHFYPPAAAALGIDLKRLIVVRPQSREDGWWSLDQALRCTAVGAVWSALPDEMDDRVARRLQLAAEAGGSLGLFVRNMRTRNQPSWADVQWQVRTSSHSIFSTLTQTPLSANYSGRCVQVDLIRCRSGAGHGGYRRQSIWLELGQPIRQPLPTSIFSSAAETLCSTVKTTWIRELPAPASTNHSTHSMPQQTHMRNDSYGSKHTSSPTQRMAAQLAVPTSSQSTATTAPHHSTVQRTSPTRAVSA